ncbi:MULTISPECIES: GspE/PulE/PilB domain-containing protein [Nostocales]|uniref:Pilus assembly protein PilB n=3 Tax=Nostocales TaxID=1161 RepID=A0A0C1QSE1_9CYAN|nr:type II secretory pathway, ATPase PulE/Tfp pilus assembly pathway, ATPase PilB [Tolypothrix bouteillei]KAF3889855.1 pilus assembly protein PilB [Tolypothrix bouteillei VB521301]
MLSSEGKPADTAASGKQVLPSTQNQSEQGLDREQIFRLIESTLSFEACLYHQILPFNIKDNNLVLGMVNPQDNAAIDYVNRILPYINCTMETQPINGDTHRTILSAYLNHKNTGAIAGKPMPKSWEDIAQEKKPAAIVDSSDTQINTIIPEAPERRVDKTHTQAQTVHNGDTVWQFGYSTSLNESEGSTPTPHHERPSSTKEYKDRDGDRTTLPSNLHVLHLPSVDIISSVEELATLPPRKLLEQLLGRVLSDGIGRLYLERRPYHGRILWSENGVLQSVLEKVPLSVFQGVLNELKRFASLPMTTVVEPKQVEKECLYQHNRLLLRLRVMPGMYGEEATLQVLRGAALKFYQQQQLARLSRDAVGISQQLTYKLRELKDRLALNSNLNNGQLEAFNSLNLVLENLDLQIKALTDIPEQPKKEKKKDS